MSLEIYLFSSKILSFHLYEIYYASTIIQNALHIWINFDLLERKKVRKGILVCSQPKTFPLPIHFSNQSKGNSLYFPLNPMIHYSLDFDYTKTKNVVCFVFKLHTTENVYGENFMRWRIEIATNTYHSKTVHKWE